MGSLVEPSARRQHPEPEIPLTLRCANKKVTDIEKLIQCIDLMVLRAIGLFGGHSVVLLETAEDPWVIEINDSERSTRRKERVAHEIKPEQNYDIGGIYERSQRRMVVNQEPAHAGM